MSGSGPRQSQGVFTTAHVHRLRRLAFPIALSVLAIGLVVMAYPIPHSDARRMLFGIAVSLVTATVVDVVRMVVESAILRYVRTIVHIVSLGLAAAFVFAYGCRLRTASFPTRGLIADFVTGAGGPARTVVGTQFSIMSDSTWNLDSKCWYRRLTDELDGCGYLRVYYQLKSDSEVLPYVGIHADFSLPPARPFDVSGFHMLSIRMRLGQPVDTSPITVALVLYSANVRNPDYAYPVYYVPSRPLTTEWQIVHAPFSEFGPPNWVNYTVELDPKQVFRVAILVCGRPKDETFGHVDIRDICFSD